jgi:hypothetical protein
MGVVRVDAAVGEESQQMQAPPGAADLCHGCGKHRVGKEIAIADALADALLKMENGEDISSDDRQLLVKVLDELSPAPEVVEPEDTLAKDMLALKKKKLELLMKGL